jgi:hypothetical protein
MATSYSPNLALTLQGTNDNPGTWGDITNTNLGTLLEQAISGYEVQSLTSGTTLTLTIPNGSSGVARNMYLEFTGNGSTVIVPANKKLYFVYNNCSSGTITMKVAGQTGVTVANGEKMALVSNGTDIVEAITVSALEGITTAATTALGIDAGDSVTTGTSSVFVGYEAGTSVTTGNFTTAVGYGAARSIVSASSTTALGYFAGYNLTGNFNTAIGRGAMQGGGTATGTENTAVGMQALNVLSTGGNNSCFGFQAGYDLTTANWNTLIGAYAGQNVISGAANTLVGYQAGNGITTGTTNSALGDSAYLTGNYTNSTCLGYDSAVTGNSQVQLGASNTTTYAYGAVQDRSDARDKADIQDTDLGLSFIMALQPRKFRWDMRDDYKPPKPGPDATPEDWAAYDEACKLDNLTHDGTHKRNRFHQGLIAQEVKATMDAMGVDFGGYQDHKINGGQDVLSIGYEEMIAPLIKAIQELKAEFDEYKRTHP